MRVKGVYIAAGKEAGFVFLGALFLVVVMGIALAVTGSAWSTLKQRESEEELIFRGSEIARAIRQYYNESPGGAKLYPVSLEDLVDDRRFPVTKRHLRRVYDDPMSGTNDWILIRAESGGGIMGVKSPSGLKPFRTDGFTPEMNVPDEAAFYSDWEFKFDVAAANSGATAKKKKVTTE